MAHVLVTGGAGFIGSHLVARLCADGHTVRVLDNLTTGSRDNLADSAAGIEFMEGDVCDGATVRCAVDGVAQVFHLAAHVSVPESVAQPRHTMAVNVEGTAQVAYAAAAAGVERLFFASSCAVYGEADLNPIPETRPAAPQSPYGASKLMAECLLGQLHRPGTLPVLACRFFNVYGPRQRADSAYAGVIAQFLDRAARSAPLVIYGDGEQTRDYVTVEDVVDFLVRAFATDPAGWPEVVNVGTGRAVTVRDLAAQVQTLTDGTCAIEYAESRPGDLRHSCADVRLAADRVGAAPATSLAEGLRTLWETMVCGRS